MIDPLNPPKPFSLPVMLCPACEHGINPHGLDPGGPCGVGMLSREEGASICGCLWDPNDIAATLVRTKGKWVETLPEVPLISPDANSGLAVQTTGDALYFLTLPSPGHLEALAMVRRAAALIRVWRTSLPKQGHRVANPAAGDFYPDERSLLRAALRRIVAAEESATVTERAQHLRAVEAFLRVAGKRLEMGAIESYSALATSSTETEARIG